VPADAVAANEQRDDKRSEGVDRERRRDRDNERREKFGRDRRDERKDKGERRGERDRGDRERGRDKRDGGPSHRQYATSASPRDRDRPVDPNSPFAKLAALKEQLTANRKD
jgi:ATP-dependent RNA helicase SUPV3L1/SUV3